MEDTKKGTGRQVGKWVPIKFGGSEFPSREGSPLRFRESHRDEARPREMTERVDSSILTFIAQIIRVKEKTGRRAYSRTNLEIL